jgi:ASC-1-like (ASCH) protein
MATTPSAGSSRPTPYGSAVELPSYQEMAQLIKGGKLLTRLIARDQREKLLEVEREMNRLIKVVDDFYDRLGSRNWIFHDMLSVDKIEAILAATSDAESAERLLIELYRDEASKWWLMRLRGHDGLRQRYHQIERAKDHYDTNQFDSCVLQLIVVMDGFVNDLEPSVRKGLTSRDPDDMTAWDSVVGHHMGLTHALKTFTRTIKKRIDDEVFEIYRHGIVHGSVVKFDNVVVATKAWNMLFAVADWATATHKAAEPRKPQPSWSDTWSTLKRHAAYKKYEKGFVPSIVTPSEPGFECDEVVLRASEFLDAWQHQRWGLVAAFTPPMLVGSKSDKATARYAKDAFQQYGLAKWNISAATHDQASAAEIQVAATVDDRTLEIRFRMVLWTAAGNVAMPGDDGASWRLAVWAPNTFFREA